MLFKKHTDSEAKKVKFGDLNYNLIFVAIIFLLL